MKEKLIFKRAKMENLRRIIELLIDDELGRTREELGNSLDPRYIKAFEKINEDPHQHLMVVERGGEIVGTCHLTLMPSLSFKGSMRLNIEAVHVAQHCRGQGIGTWMMRQAIEYGKSLGASIVQLTTNKKRLRAKAFYERLGFHATHEGMKLMLES